MNESKPYRRQSLIFPLILILIGVLWLLNNLGILDESLFGAAWRLWPLLLLVLSADLVARGRGVFGPSLLGGLAIIYLWAYFGPDERSAFQLMQLSWPLLIIAAGIELLVERRSVWLAGLGVASSLGLLGLLLLSTAGILTIVF